MRDIIKVYAICILIRYMHINSVLCVVIGNKVIKWTQHWIESLVILLMNEIFKKRKCF